MAGHLFKKGFYMAERHAHPVHDADTSAEEVVTSSSVSAHQEHVIFHEALVTIHGGHFHVKDGKYRWHLKDPKGHDVPLHNADSAEPSFVAELIGDYVAKLSTEKGLAQLTFHVIA